MMKYLLFSLLSWVFWNVIIFIVIFIAEVIRRKMGKQCPDDYCRRSEKWKDMHYEIKQEEG